MTEEKTCYNCGNPNCHIPLNSVRINVKEHHEFYDWDMKFNCMNHDKWEELKVEEIRTDNTETLKNALERIKELEKENAELRSIADFQTSSNMDRYFQLKRSKEQLTKAKGIIRTLYYIIQGRIDYEDNIQIKDSMDSAKSFLNEVKL